MSHIVPTLRLGRSSWIIKTKYKTKYILWKCWQNSIKDNSIKHYKLIFVAFEYFFFKLHLIFMSFFVTDFLGLRMVGIFLSVGLKRNVCAFVIILSVSRPLRHTNTNNKMLQLVSQHCCETVWKAMLRVIPSAYKLVLHQNNLTQRVSTRILSPNWGWALKYVSHLNLGTGRQTPLSC